MGHGQVMDALTTATAATVAPILEAAAQAPEVQATRAEVDRLTQKIDTGREQRAALAAAEATAIERTTALRDARTALLAAELAGEVIDPERLTSSAAELFAGALAQEDAATRVRLSDDSLRALEGERDAAGRAARRAEIEALAAVRDRAAADVDTSLAVARDHASVYVVLEAQLTRLVTQDGGQGIRNPPRQVEAAVAFHFRPIFYAGHAAAPLAASARTHATPAADALEWEEQRRALEPASPAPEAAVVTASDDGWTRRG